MDDKKTADSMPQPLPPPWDRLFSLGTRLFVWGILFGILWVLQPFFLLVFLTFVFAYVLEHASQRTKHIIRPRTWRIVTLALLFVAAFSMTAVWLAPAIQKQAGKIGREYPSYVRELDALLDGAREKVPGMANLLPKEVTAEQLIESAVGFVIREDEEPQPKPRRYVPVDPNFIGPPVPPGMGRPDTEVQESGDDVPAVVPPEKISEKIENLRDIATPLLSIAGAFLLSILFSFLIVLDLPRLHRGVRGLRHTKIGFIYREVGGNVYNLGKMLGRALEAQLMIALCNTFLTVLGLWALGLADNLIFLSAVVFFFSFIPVFGVFISSTPICLDALSAGGVQLFLAAILVITFVHIVEAYILNPRIFGHHLHMNPVFVLIVLTVAGKLFGLWGLILGLPIVNYIFREAIRYREQRRVPAKAT
ncbi:MAG: AI-2E family transporter [Planctomycetota bacterium]